MIIEVSLPNDPILLARAIRDRSGAFALVSSPIGAWRPDDARFSFVGCDPIDRTEALAPPTPRGTGIAPRWVGVIPYEAVRSERAAWTRADTRPPAPITTPLWDAYDAVACIDHKSGRVFIEADDRAAAQRLHAALRVAPAATVPRAKWSFADAVPDDAAHAKNIETILALIAEGDTYQVNLARRFTFSFEGEPFAVFEHLSRVAPSPFGFFWAVRAPSALAIAATSPELALAVKDRTIRTAPIKGTRPRGSDASEDQKLAQDLDAEPKERSELTMAIDLHRNDLGRICVPGSIRLLGEPRVVSSRTVHSRVAEIVGRLRDGIDLERVFSALLPGGSVTGAPKVRAMEIIADLEPVRRGVYTGAFGYVGRDGNAFLAVAIRTAVVDGSSLSYFTGGGIVAESQPAREVEETHWKAVQIAEGKLAAEVLIR